MTPSSRFLQVLAFLIIAAGSLTCSGDKLILPDEGDPSDLTMISGNAQAGIVGSLLTDSVVVRVTDSKARPVIDARVQFLPGTNGSGGDLIPDTVVTDADGRARAMWVLGTRAGIQMATARVVGFNQVSTSFTATATADVADTVFALSGDGQTGTVGQALAESLVVRVNDRFGNPVGGIPAGWSVSGGGSVSAPAVTTGANGQSAVRRVLGPTAGPQGAAATASGLKGSPVAFSHTAVAGGPTGLLKTDGDNQTAPAGTFLAESLDVRLVDGTGNGVAGRSIAFTPSPSNGSSAPTSAVTDVNGFASSRWTLGAGTGSQSLIASGAGFSVTFTATATSDMPTQMAISAGNNQTAVAGTAVTIPPAVRVRDVNNNPVANVSVTFTVTAGGGTVTGPSGSGASTIVATNGSGVAALNSWTLGSVVGSNIMSAAANGPGGPLTGSPLQFNGTGIAGPAAQITITTEPPATAASGATLSITPLVQIRDAGGNSVNQANIGVTASLVGGGSLTGTKTQQSNGSGQASFPGLSISGLAGAYMLAFSSGGLTPDTSVAITLSAGVASRLVLTTQPSSSAQSGVVFGQQPVAQIQDGAGNPVSQSNTPVTASIATGGGTLTGNPTINTDLNGTASFTDLAISGASGGRTLDFNASGLSKATSSVVTIGAGGATQLAFGVQPSNTTAGSAISPAVTVLVQDASGNTVPGAANSVTIGLGNNPSAATLSGTLTVNAVNGVATFPDLGLDTVGTAYTLTAAASGLGGATSGNFNITPGSVSQLVFTQQPSNVIAGASIAPAVTVTAQDALGNTVTSYAASVSLALGNNPGSATLSGGGGVTPVAGVASFPALSINRTGVNYTLVANSGVLTKISGAFSVSPGSASQLVFIQQPSNSVAGSNIAPPVQVAVRDALGNTVTGATTAIALTIGTNPPGNGVLTGGGAVNAVNGVATFGTLKIDKPGTGYTLVGDGGGLPSATSAGFDISPGSGNKLAFIVNPSTAEVGEPVTPAIQVQIQDGAGNPVSGTNAITLVIGSNPGSATLTGGGPVNAVGGVATFSNARLNQVGTGYNLTALASGLLSTTSGSFDINPAATATTITSDNPDPSRVGQAVNVVFGVAALAPGSGTPTGTVTVSDGTVSCQASVAAGTCQLFPTIAGAKTITASYAGDGNFTASASTGAAHQVNPANTTILVTSDNPDPSVVGQPVTVNFNVTVNAPGDGTPTGNVTVSSGSDVCVVPVSAGSCSLVLTSPGAKTITANYPGDGNFNPSSDNRAHTVNKAASTVTITSDLPDPSGAGEAVSVAYTVVANAPGVGTPTGNVVVTVSGSSDTCTATVAAGSCSLIITTVGSGKIITAAYSGDANFLSDTDTQAHDVNTGSTMTTVTSTVPSASEVGQSVAIHYGVTPLSGGTPTGTVTVSDGTQSCNATVAAGQCSITFNTAGARTLVATYGGDANFSGSVSPGFGQQVNTASTTTSIAADTPDPSVVGQAYTVSYSVGVVVPGGGTPTGSVIVNDGVDTCTGSVAAGSCSLTSSSPGSKNLVAAYQGDGNYTGSNSATAPHVVNQAGTTTTITADNPDPSSIGQAVVLNFTVAAALPGSGTPTGNVTVSDGVDSCIGTVAAGTCSITLNTGGSRPLTATYAGDLNFTGSASAAEPHTVGLTGTTTTITGHTPDPSVTGQTVAVSVTVSGGSTPTGTVTVSDGSTSCIATLSGGAGGCNLTPGTAGARTLTGTYSGDASHGGSTSPGAGHTVNQAGTTTTITSDNPDPSGTGAAVTVTYSVTVNPPGGGSPGGNVTVSDGTDSCIGTVAAGSCDVVLSTVGPRNLTATYAGNADFSGSGSAPEPHNVSVGTTTTLINSHTPDPSVAGQAVAVAVTVSGGIPPTGTVTVSDGTTSCIVTLALGAGSCNITLGAAGSHTLTGTYGGDILHGGSTSPGVAHTVSQAGTTTAITSDNPDPSGLGQAVAVAFTVLAIAPGSGAPSGNVTVSDGVDSCIGTVAAGTCNVTLNTSGSRPLTATYAGDANFSGSGSAPAPHTVNLNSTTSTITSDLPSPSVIGQGITVNVSVTSGGGTPTGSVSVTDGTDGCNITLSGGAGGCVLTPSTSGTKSLVATYAGAGIFAGSTSPGVSHQVDPFGAVSASQSSVAVSNGAITASTGGSATTITVTARDGFNNLISGATVVLATTPGTGDNLVQPPGTTNGSGQAQGSFSATGSGSRTISATINGVGITQTQLVAVNPDVLDPASSIATVPTGAAGNQTTITIQARDQFGNDLTGGGAAVVVTISGSNTDSGAVTDHGDGTYTATYTPVNPGSDSIDITINGTPIQGSPFTSTIS